MHLPDVFAAHCWGRRGGGGEAVATNQNKETWGRGGGGEESGDSCVGASCFEDDACNDVNAAAAG